MAKGCQGPENKMRRKTLGVGVGGDGRGGRDNYYNYAFFSGYLDVKYTSGHIIKKPVSHRKPNRVKPVSTKGKNSM